MMKGGMTSGLGDLGAQSGKKGGAVELATKCQDSSEEWDIGGRKMVLLGEGVC